MKLSHAIIFGAAIMIVAPAYAQNYDNQRTSERHVTSEGRHKYVAPRFVRHTIARHARYYVQPRYSFQQERQTTADLNRRSMQGQDLRDYNR